MAGRGIVINISADPSTTKAALEQIRAQMKQTADEAKEDASGIAEAWERVRGAIESVGLYMGVREAIDGIKELVGGSMELGEAMMQAHERTGLTVETLSTLHYAAAITGQDFEGLVNGIGRMNKTIGDAADGNKKAAGFMTALGLNAKDLAGRTDGAEIAFHKFVQTLAATEDPIRRNELAMGLMGRAGSAQIPVLIEIAQHWDEFRAKAEAAGVQLNETTAEALAQASQRMKDLEEHVRGAGLALTEGMAPGLTQIFGIITGGKSQLEQMNLMGENLSKTFAFLGMVFYSAAAAAERFFSEVEFHNLTEAGRRDEAAYEGLKQKAEQLHDIAFGDGAPKASPLISGLGSGAGGAGFEGAGEKTGKTKAPKSENGIAEAAAALASEQAKATADAQRDFDQQRLAELEAQHKMLLVSDQEYYAEKLNLQNEMLDAQESALRSRGAALQTLLTKQQGDKAAKRDKDGNSVEELRTQRELLQVQEQIGALEAKRGELSSANIAEVAGSGKEAELANLRAAAELEKQRNDGITAQIALVRREKDLEAQKATSQGGTDEAAAQIRAQGELEVKSLQLVDLNRQIEATLNDNTRATKAWSDAAEKNPLLKNQATEQINQLNGQAAKEVQGLVDQYYALAVTMGGPALEAAKNLRAEVEKLQTPNQRSDAAWIKELDTGIAHMANSLVENTALGTESFHKMVKGIEKDALELALKLAEQKFLFPGGSGGSTGSGAGGGIASFFSGLFGAAGEHHMSGGQSSGGPQVLGEDGPELWTPPQSGGSVTPSNMLTKLADSGGGGAGGRGVSITSNIINQTSNPVNSQPSEVSYDSQLREFVIHTVLMDHSQNGPIAQSMGGMQSS